MLRQASAEARRSCGARRMDMGLWHLGVGFVIVWSGGEFIKKKKINKRKK